MTIELLYAITFFIFGAAAGSFLNVCIVRMPKEESIVWPGSHCVRCQKPIFWYDNIPLFSYVLLGGKCRHCKAAISFRYFLVELITAITFAAFYLIFGLQWILLPYLFMMGCFIVATFVDFEHRIIPDEVSLGGALAGVIFSLLITDLHEVKFEALRWGSFMMIGLLALCVLGHILIKFFYKEPPEDPQEQETTTLIDRIFLWLIPVSLGTVLLLEFVVFPYVHGMPENLKSHLLSLEASMVGLLVGGGSIYVMGLLGDLLFRKESMGGGDIKLMAMVGSFLGWKLALLSFFIAPFFGAIYGIVEKLRTKDSTIAYGPFLVLGSIVSLFWGSVIIDWIMSGYGLYR